MCRKAFDIGLCAIGFSAHAPLPFKTTWHLPQERLEEYSAEVRAAAQEWRGRLAVYLGLEIDYISGRFGPADGRFSSLGLDYSIGSVHYLTPPNGAAPFTVDGPYEEWENGVREGFAGDGEAAAEAYWKAVAEMVRAGGFDIVGHLDLVKKNNRARDGNLFFDPDGPRYRAAAAEALRAIEEAGTVVEINTGALNRRSLTETYPSPALLADLRKQGARIVVNADAHRMEHLGGYYDEAVAALRVAGFSETVLLDGGVWRAEPLN